MDFTEVLKTIVEKFGGVGVFVVCVLMITMVALPIVIPIMLDKKLTKNNKDLTTVLSTGLIDIGSTITQTMAQQNAVQQDLLVKIIDKLPDTAKEREKHDSGQIQRLDIGDEINALLLLMLHKYHASRVCILEFHNGGVNIGGLPFVKYNMEYEQIHTDVNVLGSIVQDLPAANLAPVIADLKDGTTKFKVYYKKDIEDLINRSTVLYCHLKEINVEYMIYAPLYDSSNVMIGLVAIEYIKCDNSILSDENLFNKLIDKYGLNIHDDIIKISNYLDFKKKNKVKYVWQAGVNV